MEKAGRFIEVTKVKCLPLEREGVEKSRGGKITRTRNHSTLGLIEAMGGYNNGYGIVTRKMFIAKRRNSLLRHDLRGPASRYRATRSSFRCNQILRTLCLLIASNLVTIIRLLPYLHSSRTCLALSTVTPSNEMFITK